MKAKLKIDLFRQSIDYSDSWIEFKLSFYNKVNKTKYNKVYKKSNLLRY